MDEQCPVCLTEGLVNRCLTNCDHAYCKTCLDTWFSRGNTTCPICRQDIQYITHGGETYRVVLRSVPGPRPRPRPGPGPGQRIGPNRYLYRLLTGSISVMGLLIGYELIKLYELHVDNQKTNIEYQTCEQALETRNRLVATINGDQVGTFILIDDVLRRCMIPMHYIHKCLS